jgi:MobA/MobL family
MTAAGFYHCSVKAVGRAKGRSIVAAAAYRAGIRIEDERTGEIADYRARGGVAETFVLSREDAYARAQDIGRLWNDGERAEPRANGRIATEIVFGFLVEHQEPLGEARNSPGAASRKMPRNRQRPGYVSETEKKLHTYAVQLQPEIIAAWKAATARAGIDQRRATEQVFSAFARQQGILVSPRPPRRNGSKPRSLDC